MNDLDLSELNVVASVLGLFVLLFGLIATKIKSTWYLGEALPAVVTGIVLGPVAAKFINVEKWVQVHSGQYKVTLGVMRVMIGIQLVIAGYRLPARYLFTQWKAMTICLVPIMTLMWFLTAACIAPTIKGLRISEVLIVAACVTSTDPVLSQAVATGPFADKYVPRPLREIISAEAGANDGFASPFLNLAVQILMQIDLPQDESGRFGNGIGVALREWVVWTLLYVVLLAIAYGAIVGLCSRKLIELSLKRRWIDTESYLLFPTGLALFTLGTCGILTTSDLLACFVAGCALNWDGTFLEETLCRHDEVNSCIDVLLNFGGFVYIGITIPWSSFHDPDGTGVTLPRLIILGIAVLVFRRIPALLACHVIMPETVTNWKEAIFMGYFGPIGVGAIFYLEHTRTWLVNQLGLDGGDAAVLDVMGPVVYFLVFFSILVHGLSIPALSLIYHLRGIQAIQQDPEQLRRRSIHVPTPSNAVRADEETFIAYNRFTRPARATSSIGSAAGSSPRHRAKGSGLHGGADVEAARGCLDGEHVGSGGKTRCMPILAIQERTSATSSASSDFPRRRSVVQFVEPNWNQ